MKHPFEEASTFHYQVDEPGDDYIRVTLSNDMSIQCDRIDLVMIDHVPMFIAANMYRDDDETGFFPADVIPHQHVIRIEVCTNKDELEFLGAGK